MPPLHPIIVHFPIALYLIAVLFECVIMFRIRRHSGDEQAMQQEVARLGYATKLIMLLGFISVLVAIGTGEWLKVQLGLSQSSKVNIHQALGILFAVWYAGLLFLRLRQSWKPSMLYLCLSIIGAIILVVLGDTGGSMVWSG
jgi:uncharacterized membrane protein